MSDFEQYIKESAFEKFWKAYPKKVGKLDCKRAFERMKRDMPPIAELVAIVEKHKNQPQWRKDGGAFIPYPATWVRQGRWLDEIEALETDKSGQVVKWYETSTGIERKGKELGLEPSQFDSWPLFKEEVFRRVKNG